MKKNYEFLTHHLPLTLILIVTLGLCLVDQDIINKYIHLINDPFVRNLLELGFQIARTTLVLDSIHMALELFFKTITNIFAGILKIFSKFKELLNIQNTPAQRTVIIVLFTAKSESIPINKRNSLMKNLRLSNHP